MQTPLKEDIHTYIYIYIYIYIPDSVAYLMSLINLVPPRRNEKNG